MNVTQWPHPLPNPPLASGRTADVYAWGDGTVLKLFQPWFGLEGVEQELRIARAVRSSGLAVPEVIGDVIQVQGRNGLIYQHVDGPSMLAALLKKPWMVFRCARILAELQAQTHATKFHADIPSQRDRLADKLNHAQALSDSLRSQLLQRLASMPTGEQLCHGDFHPDNILLTQSGGVMIDWIDASRGNPLADVARTSIILRGLEGDETTSPLLKQYGRFFHAAYLRNYFRLRPQGQAEYRQWLPIVAGARMSEGIQGLEPWLLEQAGRDWPAA